MTVRDTGPTDDEFSALLDSRAPNRSKDPDTWEPEATPVVAEVPVEDSPVPVAPEDGLVPEPTPVDPKYAGKTTDEIIEMHRNLESRLGAQGQELGELRSMRSELDQMKGALAERDAASSYEPVNQQTVDYVEEMVLGNPLAALDWVDKNQPALKERALATWAAIDPFAAGRYETQQLLKEQQARFDSELASVRAPVVAAQTDRQLETAYRNVSTRLQGFDEVAGDLPALLEANPELRVALIGGDVGQKERILENLGKMASFNRAVAQEAAPAPVATTPVIDPRVAASVASGSSTGEHGGETVTPTDKLKASMLASGPTSLHDELARSRAAAR